MPAPSLTNNTDTLKTDKFLEAIHHAISGSTGTLISTCTLYPLSLVITRLQAQRQIRRERTFSSTSSRSGSSVNSDGSSTSNGSSGSSGSSDSRTCDTTSTSPSGAREPPYAGIIEAFSRIWSSSGGPKAFYTGLAQDAAKSVLDSFLFFLFYEWLRTARLSARSGGRRRGGERTAPGLGMLEELAIGVVAGACSRLFTTPIANVVTRKQTASLIDTEGREISVREIINSIRKEQGLAGFWSGYSASLVLTLNPSITFFLQEFLKKKTVSADRWDNPGSHVTFLLAAVSKAVASTITYPFQTAKTRLQTGVPAASEKSKDKEAEGRGGTDDSRDAETSKRGRGSSAQTETSGETGASVEASPTISTIDEISPKTVLPPRKVKFTTSVASPERNPGGEAEKKADPLRRVKDLGERSIFGTVAQISRTEGIGSLYDGILGELLKGFLSHGTTMLAKEVVHKLLFRLYFVLASALAEIKARRVTPGPVFEPNLGAPTKSGNGGEGEGGGGAAKSGPAGLAAVEIEATTGTMTTEIVVETRAISPALSTPPVQAPSPPSSPPPSSLALPPTPRTAESAESSIVPVQPLPALPVQPSPIPIEPPPVLPVQPSALPTESPPLPIEPSPPSVEPSQSPTQPSPPRAQSLPPLSAQQLLPEPVQPEIIQSESIKPEPKQPENIQSEPVQSESVQPEPMPQAPILAPSQTPPPSPPQRLQAPSHPARASIPSTPPPPPPEQPPQQLRALRNRINSLSRHRSERPYPTPSAPAPSPVIRHASWYPSRHHGGGTSRPSDDDDVFGGSVVANMIDGTQRGVKHDNDY